MNWKDKIILGAIAGSGKFEIEFQQDHAQYNLKGEKQILNTEILFELERIGTDCKLIARHVDSMTDKERLKQFPRTNRQDFEEAFRNNEPIFADDLIYLLSIGVLPESLADEDVIWKE